MEMEMLPMLNGEWRSLLARHPGFGTYYVHIRHLPSYHYSGNNSN